MDPYDVDDDQWLWGADHYAKTGFLLTADPDGRHFVCIWNHIVAILPGRGKSKQLEAGCGVPVYGTGGRLKTPAFDRLVFDLSDFLECCIRKETAVF